MNGSTGTAAFIELLPYAPAWPLDFHKEAAMLQQVLKPWLVADIEHIGSTAVPGLCAKPVIDIMAPVQDLSASRAAIAAAQSAGYCHFPYKPDAMHWFCKPSPDVRTHHLHLVPWRSALWNERIAFRDMLRSHPALAEEYERLKKVLASLHSHDREAYTEGKSAFVATVLNAWRANLPPAA